MRHQVIIAAPGVPQGRSAGEDGPLTSPAAGLDTPSLRFVAGTAPYFHDGRYKTLEELLAAPDHAMGESTRLSRQDRAALAAYLETL
jgi:cytochrome c peroxidase